MIYSLKLSKKFNLLNFLSKFELSLWFNCNQMDMKLVTSIKYGWDTIVREKSGIWDILFRINQVSKSMPAANLRILLIPWGHKNPCEQKIFKFEFFYPKRQSYKYYLNNYLGQTSSSYINLTIKLWIKS